MKLFTSDLYRNIGIGFLGGAAIVAVSDGGAIIGALAPVLTSLF